MSGQESGPNFRARGQSVIVCPASAPGPLGRSSELFFGLDRPFVRSRCNGWRATVQHRADGGGRTSADPLYRVVLPDGSSGLFYGSELRPAGPTEEELIMGSSG